MADANTSMDFLDWTRLATIGGASAAVAAIANTVHYVLKRTSPWIPFVASLVICVGITWQKHELAQNWILAFINACLLFCTASGIQGVVVHAALSRDDAGAQTGARFRFPGSALWLRVPGRPRTTDNAGPGANPLENTPS